MTKLLSIVICLLIPTFLYSQGGNKQKLAQLDSLLKEMEKRKNDLAGQLTDFLHHSKEVAKSENQQKPTRQTISERISYSESIVRAGTANGLKPSNSLARLERSVRAVNKTLEDFEALKKQWASKKASISEMGQQDMLMLQQLMEKKNQLETMISNVMKASYEGGQAAVQALKSS